MSTGPCFVLATKNAKKREELRQILSEIAPEMGLVEADWPEVEETGETFEANALVKARAANAATGYPALADDSGLEVDALGGEPGVRSARFAGVEGSEADAANNDLLLRRMLGVENRRCRFVCVVAIVNGGVEETVRGEVEGNLRSEPSGGGGFGYDPLFEPEGWTTTFAEAGPDDKAEVSHRGRALRKAVRRLSRMHGLESGGAGAQSSLDD